MKNFILFISGALVLILNKIRHSFSGYQTPRNFPEKFVDKVIDYDIDVVETWLKYLSNYSNGEINIIGKNILEIGPGSDVGNGFVLLGKGCKEYFALDINNLIGKQQDLFYEKLILRISEDNAEKKQVLQTEYELFKRKDKSGRINYIHDSDFSFESFKDKNIDIIFSQATFEHFTDVQKTIKEFSAISKSGTVLISLVDLLTHTGILRSRDPNNIYRFDKKFYNFFRFKGSPNRVRPYQYQQYLAENGWGKVKIIPSFKVFNNKSGLNKQFVDEQNQMHYGLIFLCAVKK